jgi:hypothetical protein
VSNPTAVPPDLLDKVIRYESGRLPQKEVLPLLQSLIDTGAIWRLREAYRIDAARLGLSVPPRGSP